MKICLDASRLRLASRFWLDMTLVKTKNCLLVLQQATITGFILVASLVRMLSCEFKKTDQSRWRTLNGRPESPLGIPKPEVQEKSE